MDKILKEYANFSLDKKIHALFEHGVQITEYCNVFLGHINMSQVLYPQNIVLKY